jgi:hypothetical protein
MISQHLDIRMHFGKPIRIYVIHIRNVNFLATETSNDLCTVVARLRRSILGRGGDELSRALGPFKGV